MISFVKGQLVSKSAQSPKGPYFIVDLHGMGFEIASSSRSVESAPQPGETCLLYTSLIVREDAMSLVGFNSREERDLFNILHSAQGVGPKVALAILSALSVSEIAQAVMGGNHKPLTVAKGVGPKLAQKITVDLKEKMTQWRKLDGIALEVGGSGFDADFSPSPEAGNAFYEAENVLISLGYSPEEVRHSFTALSKDAQPENLQDSETILRESLRWLAHQA